MTCDDVLAALLLHGRGDPRVAAHLAACDACRAQSPGLEAAAAALAADAAPAPPADLGATVLRAARPLLARNARRATRARLVRAVGAALLLFPLVVLLDVGLLRAAYRVLAMVLPEPLSLYLVVNHAALLALLLALTYGSIPLLAARRVGAPEREPA